MPDLFHPLNTLTHREVLDQRTREFKGDGSPLLKVPGCAKVDAVRVGATEIPLTHTQRILLDPNDPNATLQTKDRLLALDHLGDGTPVLRRSIQSNDGRWQDGASVFVTGDWKDEEDAPVTPEATKPARGRKAA